MKRMAILASFMAASLVATGASAQGLPPITEIEQVSDNVYKIFGGGGNTTVFVRSDGVTLIDTKMPMNGEAILAEVRKVTDKPVTMIINTHAHPDHIGSNAELTAGGNVQVVAHANAARRMAQTPNAGTVNQTFEDRLTLGSGADQIDLYWFGPAHTDNDSFVVFPGERIMLMGDVMAWDMGLLIDPLSGGTMLNTPKVVGQVTTTITGVDKVIEGHGQVNDWSGLQDYRAYLQKVVEVAQKGVDENLDYVQAYDKYFAADPAMAPYTLEELKPGLEYGSTPKNRSLNNIYVAMLELRGEEVPLIMGAPPPPGSPPPAPRGPGGPRGPAARGPAGAPPPGTPGAGSQPPPGAVPAPSEHANH